MKNQNGFSLIEVIVTIAIIGILGITLLEIFGTGITNVAKAGERIEDLYSIQEVMDEAITSVESQGNINQPYTKNLHAGKIALVKIEDNTVNVETIPVAGKLITVEIEGTNQILTTFVPLNKGESDE